MKVLVIYPTPFFSPISMENYTRLLSILEAGIEVDLLTFPEGDDLAYPGLRILRYPGEKLFRNVDIGNFRKILVYTLLLFYKALTIKKKQYGLIYTSGTLTPFIWFIKYFTSVPVCALVITNLEDDLIKFRVSNNRILHYLLKQIDIFSISRYSHAFFLTKALMDRYVKCGVSKSKADVINISVAVPEFSSEPEKLKNERFTVLYAGSFVPVQNLGLLLDAAAKLADKDIAIQMIGANEAEFAKYENEIKRRNLGSIVQLLPRMQPDKLESYIRAADIMVSPRVFGFFDTPMKIFYYLYYGKCILATDYPIHTGVLDHNTAILVEDEAGKFVQKILELKANRDWITEKEKAARQLYLREYSRETQISQYRELFQRIAGEKA